MAKNCVKELRLKKQISRDEFAELCGTSDTQIYRLENGMRKLYNEEWMVKFSEVLDVYPSELLPKEWQEAKSDNNIDLSLLAESIESILQADKESSIEPTSIQLATLIANLYDKKIEDLEKLNKKQNKKSK